VALTDDWAAILHEQGGSYARTALTCIKREFPSGVYHTMTAPGDFPYRPRARTPAFYGCYDWHSSVEMHWALVRLLRAAPGAVPADEIRAALSAHFERVVLAAEEEYITGPDGHGERPYGWAWVLTLARETQVWDDPHGRKWAAALEPLAAKLAGLLTEWLAAAAYPVRHGVHANTAFSLSRALPYAAARAEAGEPALQQVITRRALEWFGADLIYPAAWEPSGHDFLSPALTEAELMAQLLPRTEFADWLGMFLPGIASREPRTLFTPAVVTDSSDGQVAHLHGLNASRAWCWRRLAASLPAGDPRAAAARAAARVHAEAALPHVTGDDYMVEHWLPAYAVLMLSTA
jgi:Protein of unknown function (DUF2891)